MKKLRKKRRINPIAVVAIFLVLFIAAFIIAIGALTERSRIVKRLYNVQCPEYVDVQLIPKGITSSRNGRALEKVNNIVIHYVGNPSTTAQQNHDYFSNSGTTVNSHFLVGLDGEVIQCIPLYERSSASNWRNKDTISIEVCHPDVTGKFNEATEERLIELTAWLCEVCKLESDDVIRHYDITGKLCPIYYVQNEDAWNSFLDSVDEVIEN